MLFKTRSCYKSDGWNLVIQVNKNNKKRGVIKEYFYEAQ
jgi:hypothetical protein